MLEKGTVTFGKRNIKFFVKRSRKRKTISLFVDPFEGVFLRAPLKPSLKILEKLVYSKAVWIITKQRLINEIINRLPKREFVTGETFMYLGRQLRLKIIKINCKTKLKPCTAKIIVKGNCFIVSLSNVKRTQRLKIVRDVLINWYKKNARLVLLRRVRTYSKKLNIPMPEIFIGSQVKRWGSCNIRKRQVRFNWRIVMAPMSIVDYLVIHELCHLKHNNHSKDFWKLVGSILPDYEARRQRLRKEGPMYYF